MFVTVWQSVSNGMRDGRGKSVASAISHAQGSAAHLEE